MTIQKLILLVGFLLFLGCANKTKESTIISNQFPINIKNTFSPQIKYSEFFSVKTNKNYKLVSVLNPWKSKDTLAKYLLIPKGKMPPEKAPKADFTLSIPINNIAISSSTHIGFIDLIDELDKINGVAKGDYIYNPYLREKLSNNQLIEIGGQMGSHLESVLSLSPDLLMKTSYDQINDEDNRLLEAGIDIAYNVEWKEASLLARAEWVKFVACFFDKDKLADSIFNKIEKDYLKVKNITKSIEDKPTILSGNNFKGTWHLPGGKNYASLLVDDAGGDYLYKNTPEKGSIALSFETVLDKMIDADFWIGPNAKSLKELSMMDERYTLFKAFKTGQVYTFNKRVNKYGGNDYWESGVARPDLILKDLIKIFHPRVLPDYQMVYFRKLK